VRNVFDKLSFIIQSRRQFLFVVVTVVLLGAPPPPASVLRQAGSFFPKYLIHRGKIVSERGKAGAVC
jgi:hypothetical protein